jgi:cytochrome b involved in lipid metabolism
VFSFWSFFFFPSPFAFSSRRPAVGRFLWRFLEHLLRRGLRAHFVFPSAGRTTALSKEARQLFFGTCARFCVASRWISRVGTCLSERESARTMSRRRAFNRHAVARFNSPKQISIREAQEAAEFSDPPSPSRSQSEPGLGLVLGKSSDDVAGGASCSGNPDCCDACDECCTVTVVPHATEGASPTAKRKEKSSETGRRRQQLCQLCRFGGVREKFTPRDEDDIVDLEDLEPSREGSPSVARQGRPDSSGAQRRSSLPPARGKSLVLPVYTAEEVAQHCTRDDLWIILRGRVFDVTDYIQRHPGGATALERWAGRDATENLQFHSQKIHVLVEPYLVGQLDTYTPPVRCAIM